MRASILLAGILLAAPLQAAEYLGSFHWTYPKPYFGGWSGIEISDDGSRFVAVGDSGQIVDGLVRREGDVITGLDFPLVKRLQTDHGKRVGPAKLFDSEGLAMAPDGTLFVSFERWARVRSFSDWTARPRMVKRHPDFPRMRSNGSLEALALGPDGALYTLAEGRPGWWRDRKIYRLKDDVWEIFDHLPATDRFNPVGADFGPDGLFYLLERQWFPLVGFRSRVRRFSVTDSGFEDGETVLETRFRTHDNLEGIAVWRDQVGRLRLTMVADDNFSRFQRTEIVEYAVPDRVEP